MQTNSNRPVYVAQAANITHLNVRPSIITTGGQQFPTQVQQAPVYQLSSVRTSMLPQQVNSSNIHPTHVQTSLLNSSPVYASVQPQRFAVSPQATTTTTTSNVVPSRFISPQTVTRIPMVTVPPPSLLTRPMIQNVVTSPVITAATTPPPSGSKDFVVRVSK
jgi:hypothetical protein